MTLIPIEYWIVKNQPEQENEYYTGWWDSRTLENLGDALGKLDKTAGGEIYGTSSVYKFILSGRKPTGTAIEK
jgi:hypothetical protein